METRLGILWLWRSVRAVDIDDGALDELAHQDVESVGALLDIFNRLAAQREREPDGAGIAGILAEVARAPQAPPPDEFENFLSEVTAVVSSSVEQWRSRLASAVARWAGEGYSTESLEGFLDGREPPDLDAVETRFAAAVNQLRDLEQEAARLDPRLAGVSVFRDPGRLDEARDIVMRALAAYDPPPSPAEHLTISALATGPAISWPCVPPARSWRCRARGTIRSISMAHRRQARHISVMRSATRWPVVTEKPGPSPPSTERR
jgi:hypothetical protein